MPYTNHTKIVATLGPASSDVGMIKNLALAGASIFRFNFSHSSHAEHAERYKNVRQVEAELGRPLAILADLQGPKLRVGKFKDGKVTLANGARLRFDLNLKEGTDQTAPLPHPEIFAALKKGTELLLDDGKLRVRVETVGDGVADCTVVVGGVLSNNKGVNIPNAVLPMSPLTTKDRADLAFALQLGVDLVALSFVQTAADIQELRDILQVANQQPLIVAKLEKPAAIEHLEEIVALTDTVMVARGDLGVEMPPEFVPSLQKQIVRVCRRLGKPVIVATQMLESMITSPTPTRAEASDVATAVYDGADAVMLSAESAAGQFPIDAVAMMQRIIDRVENDPLYPKLLDAASAPHHPTTSDAICVAVRDVSEVINAAAIVGYTTTGSTILRMAHKRPNVPIIALTPDLATARRLTLVWGVYAMPGFPADSFENIIATANTLCRDRGFAKTGDNVIVVAGMPFGQSGSTNMLRVLTVQ